MYRRGGPLEEKLTLVEQELENVNSRTVQLVKLLTEVGPDVPEISRRLGQFKESVRYRYKEKILYRGFAVQAAVDHERLGLRRLILIAEVSDTYKQYAPAIFSAMNELCYVTGFTKTLVGGEYVIHVSAPSELVSKVRTFFLNLRDKGMFSSLEILEFEWHRIAPMKAEYYDFDTGRWDFDWQKGSQDRASATFVPSPCEKFDNVDLLIVKELQIDANKSLKEISDKLGINYKKLAWHCTAHVLGRKMISGYTVNWMGTRYDDALEKALHRKHRYFALEFFVRDVNEHDLMTLRHGIDGLPFLWGEAGGRNYYAGIALPVDNVVEGLEYIGNITSAVKSRLSIYPSNQTEATAFTISYKLYDPVQKTWTFNDAELTARFDKLMLTVREGVARPN
jgi:DNA-binding Lrp family transcriptional regulator